MFDLDASSTELRMGDKVYTCDDYDCFECFQFKCQANGCPHHIGTGFGARESGKSLATPVRGLLKLVVGSNPKKSTPCGEQSIQSNMKKLFCRFVISYAIK